ncbi:hypothetical protein V6N13_048342 [Hibiscus sabdariffa]
MGFEVRYAAVGVGVQFGEEEGCGDGVVAVVEARVRMSDDERAAGAGTMGVAGASKLASRPGRPWSGLGSILGRLGLYLGLEKLTIQNLK